MKEIDLNGKAIALIDDDDFARVSRLNWCVLKKRGVIKYARNNNGLMHRFILNVSDGIFVDHKDGNGLNNQKGNLRIATQGQNARNAIKRTVRTSRFKGVRKIEYGWQARITFEKKCYAIGFFKTEEEAALAYNDKAKKLHGEFAKLNVL